MITRRQMLKGLAAAPLAIGGVSGYAVAEPFRLRVTTYAPTPANWPADLHLKIAALADIHACEPWMSAARIRQIVARTNALKPDLVVLLGDYVAGTRIGRYSRHVADADWAGALSGLQAPLGVHAILGNHDWWADDEAQRRRSGPTKAGLALERAGMTVHDNTCLRLGHGNRSVWLAGLGDQWAFWPRHRTHGHRRDRHANRFGYQGIDDLAGTLAKVTDDAPVILLAHEPDIFPQVPAQVSLTLSGHTHGGQVQLLGYAPVVPSMYGRRYLYGHVVEDDRHIIVSGGLGCSGVPVRFGVPPEIVWIELGRPPATV